MRIALATCRELPTLDADDHAYVDALRARGVTVTLPIWNATPFDPHAGGEGGDDADADKGADKGDVDAVIVRSTWDYSEHRSAFVAWAVAVDEKTRLLNPSSTIRWNTDKQLYLTDLAGQGVATVPTLWLHERPTSLAALVGAQPWSTGADGAAPEGVVIKPIIGAGARDTIFVPAGDIATVGQRFVDEQLQKQALMVQPFLPGIKDGEVSLIYIDGAYSHAVIKLPKAGDFRSQPEFGSRILRHTPTTAQRTVADHALHQVHGGKGRGRPLYARADLVTGLDGQPTLIELEMVEPSLYLGWSDDGAGRFADATIARAGEPR